MSLMKMFNRRLDIIQLIRLYQCKPDHTWYLCFFCVFVFLQKYWNKKCVLQTFKKWGLWCTIVGLWQAKLIQIIVLLFAYLYSKETLSSYDNVLVWIYFLIWWLPYTYMIHAYLKTTICPSAKTLPEHSIIMDLMLVTLTIYSIKVWHGLKCRR